ncbi:hypothetical protein GGR53DRAFT_463541 [Hypoxylon sp. FL1150]|nr:hypothetical protein GGR53DRAFT_463541 [Hypoxylon sp. FL1150]
MVVTLHIVGSSTKSKLVTDHIFLPRAKFLTEHVAYSESTNTSAMYGTIAVIFLFQVFYVFAWQVASFKMRATVIAIFRVLDVGFEFYLINAIWNLVFLVTAYFTFVETKGLKLEKITPKFEGSQIIENVLAEASMS